MSKKRKNPLENFGSLCKQLITMCQKSRNDRFAEQRLVKSVETTPDESLTQLIGDSSRIRENEQNSHEDFYRLHYEN